MLNKAIKKAKENKKGFTLAELLIVVAIIAVLVAISIPIFTSQLEKSRESVDMANIRAAYAEVMTAALTEDTALTETDAKKGVVYNSTNKTWTMTVDLKQTKDSWQSDITGVTIGDLALDNTSGKAPKAGKTASVVYTAGTATSDGTIAITFAQ